MVKYRHLRQQLNVVTCFQIDCNNELTFFNLQMPKEKARAGLQSVADETDTERPASRVSSVFCIHNFLGKLNTRLFALILTTRMLNKERNSLFIRALAGREIAEELFCLIIQRCHL